MKRDEKTLDKETDEIKYGGGINLAKGYFIFGTFVCISYSLNIHVKLSS